MKNRIWLIQVQLLYNQPGVLYGKLKVSATPKLGLDNVQVVTTSCKLIVATNNTRNQGQHQGKSLEGVKVPRGTGVQGAEPVGGGRPWSWCLFRAKIVIKTLSEYYFLVKDDRKANFGTTLMHGNTPCFLIFPFSLGG